MGSSARRSRIQFYKKYSGCRRQPPSGIDLAVRDRDADGLDLDLLPDAVFHIGLAVEPGVELLPARELHKDRGADHLAGVVEDGAGVSDLAFLHHRLDALE